MKKYLLSTLTAAAAMAVPAFSAELIAGWDFSEYNSGTTGTIYATSGKTSLYISTGSSVNDSGSLYIQPNQGTSYKATINVSGESLTTDEGISIVMEITGWSSGTGGTIFASYETDNTSTNHNYAAAIGESGSGASRSGWFAADGSSDNVDVEQGSSLTIDTTWNNPSSITIAMTFIGDTLSLYQLQSDGTYTLVATGVMNSYNGTDHYNNISGSITDIAIGSWDDSSVSSEFNNLSISSLEIYRGDIMAAPEPALFSMFFGLGAVGLVATRRRRRKVA